MNKTIKRIIEIVKNAENETVLPKEETIINYDAHITYPGGDVVTINIKGKLKDVSCSDDMYDRYLTFSIETERGLKYIDYNIKHNYTCINWRFEGDDDESELNETVDKNTPIQVWRQILNSIKS